MGANSLNKYLRNMLGSFELYEATPWSLLCPSAATEQPVAMISLLRRLVNKIFPLKSNSENTENPLDGAGEKTAVKKSFTSIVSHRDKRPSHDKVADNSYLHSGKKTDPFGWVRVCSLDKSKTV